MSEIDPQIEILKKREPYMFSALLFAKTSLEEIDQLDKFRGEEADIVNSHTISFYRISLHYFFIMEYTKIAAPPHPSDTFEGTKNAANFSIANKEIFLSRDKSIYEDNLAALSLIQGSPFFGKIQTWRNEKFAHIDASQPTPFGFTFLKEDEIKIGYDHIQKLEKVFNTFAHLLGYGVEVSLHEEGRTEIFLKDYIKLKKKHWENWTKDLMAGKQVDNP